MTLRLLTAVALAAGLAGPALAQPSNAGGGGVFGVRPSTDLGTAQTVQSAEARAERQFARVDLSKNGEITRGEWGAASLYRPDFDALDQDHDGKISLAEWVAKLGSGPPPGKSR